MLDHSQITYSTFRHANFNLCHFNLNIQNWTVFVHFNKIVNLFQNSQMFTECLKRSKYYCVKISGSSSLPIFYKKSYSGLNSDLWISDHSPRNNLLKIHRVSDLRNSSGVITHASVVIYCTNFMVRFITKLRLWLKVRHPFIAVKIQLKLLLQINTLKIVNEVQKLRFRCH